MARKLVQKGSSACAPYTQGGATKGVSGRPEQHLASVF
jgi:hypothetical protein